MNWQLIYLICGVSHLLVELIFFKILSPNSYAKLKKEGATSLNCWIMFFSTMTTIIIWPISLGVCITKFFLVYFFGMPKDTTHVE